MSQKTEVVVATMGGKDIMAFDNAHAATAWAEKRKELHGDNVAQVQVITRTTIIIEEVINHV